MSSLRITREKETFKAEIVCGENGPKLVAKASVDYKELTFNIKPEITSIHGTLIDFSDYLSEIIKAATEECELRIEKYLIESGARIQGDLSSDQPEESR